jgi:predicted secreted acid phosphatase
LIGHKSNISQEKIQESREASLQLEKDSSKALDFQAFTNDLQVVLLTG